MNEKPWFLIKSCYYIVPSPSTALNVTERFYYVLAFSAAAVAGTSWCQLVHWDLGPCVPDAESFLCNLMHDLCNYNCSDTGTSWGRGDNLPSLPIFSPSGITAEHIKADICI